MGSISYKHYVRDESVSTNVYSVYLGGTQTILGTDYYYIKGYPNAVVGQFLKLDGFVKYSSINGIHEVLNYSAPQVRTTIDVVAPGVPTNENGTAQYYDPPPFRQVYPLGFNSSRFTYEKINESINAFTHKISGELLFTNNRKDGIEDYTYFKTLLDSGDCTELTYKIEKICDGVAETYWQGRVSLTDGKWDEDRCTFSVQPFVSDNYDCLLNEKEINILSEPNTVTVNALNVHTRCRMFSNVLDFVAKNTCSNITGIVSDFFQINEVTTSTINYASGEINKYTEMAMSAITDIRNPIPSDPATVANITFKQFMEDLYSLFRVAWYIDGNNKVRIEHVSFFSRNNGLDLTQGKYKKYMSGTNKYSFDIQDMPKYEIWEMPNSDQGAKITYDNNCVNNVVNENEKRYTLSVLYTDYYRCYYEPEKISDDDKKIFLFATETIIGQKYMLGKHQNEELVLPRLVLKFHRHGLHQLTGTLVYKNGQFDFTEESYGDFMIISKKGTKKQIPISIPLCCDDDFSADDIVTTSLGFGIPKDASFTPKDNMLTLNLIYGQDEITNISPNDLSGLQLWLKADVGVTISGGGKVSQWDDQSTNTYTIHQPAGDSFRPTRVLNQINGLPVIRFGGNLQLLHSSTSIGFFPNKRGSVFILHKKEKTSLGHGQLIGTYTTGSGNMWDISYRYNGLSLGSDKAELYSFSTSAFYPAEGYVSAGNDIYGWDEYMLFELVRSGDVIQEVWLSGKPPIENPMFISDTQWDSNVLNIGGDNLNATSYINGDIAEIVIYNRAVTQYERQQIERYFVNKYAIGMYHIS